MFGKQLLSKLFQNSRKNLLKSSNSLHRQLCASVVDENIVAIKQNDGKSLKFPAIWLRDNCQCPQCFHEQTVSRKVHWDRFDFNARVKNVNVSENSVSIDWSDAHTSEFNLNWLQERDFAVENRQRYIDEVFKPASNLWNKEQISDILKCFEFNDVLSRDDALLAWLEALATNGIVILKNASNDSHVVRQLAERIGYIKRTTYGEEFSVKSKIDARNYAYMMTPLPLHTDMPYFDYKPGINILHYMVQSNSAGGANLVTDGFYIAQQMREQHPEYFETLSTVPVDWYDIGKDNDMSFHSICRLPVICLDVDGQYQRINHNTTKRDSHFTVDLDKAVAWYKAYDKFLELINAEAVEFKVNQGDVLAFNNLRMLHGRTAFTDSTENQRHLIGAYVDWDIIYSKMRILKTAQKKN